MKGDPMKLLSAAAVLLALTCSGCMTGPSYCQNRVADLFDGVYKDEPLAAGALTDVIPARLICTVFAFIPDFLILNPIQFWGFDVWRREGAPYKHKNPPGKVAWFLSEPQRRSETRASVQ